MVATIRELFAMIETDDRNGLRRFLEESTNIGGMLHTAMMAAINARKLEIVKMFCEDYPSIFCINDKYLSNAILNDQHEMAMYIISQGPPLKYSSLLYDALVAEMYDILDILIDHGLIEKNVCNFDKILYCDLAESPKNVRYFVKMGGWHDSLSPKDYLFEISMRKHGHIPCIKTFLETKDTRVYDSPTDVAVVCYE